MENNNQYEHNSFVLYKDSRIFIKKLNTEQRGILLEVIFDYACDRKVPDLHEDGMVQICFEIIKSYLDRDEKKYQDKCRQRAESGRKGGLAKASNSKQSKAKASNSKQCLTNLADKDTDTDTDSVSVIDTDTDTVSDTDTEQADADSADRLPDSAVADADPSGGDLFSVKQLLATTKKNKVNLTEEGVHIFHEEMHESGWMLYDYPVEKKNIVRALRGWAKQHPEYGQDKKENNKDDFQCVTPTKYLGTFKTWLKYHDYKLGIGDFSEEIPVKEEIFDVIFEIEDIKESMLSINQRLADKGFNKKDIGQLTKLFYKWVEEKNAIIKD